MPRPVYDGEAYTQRVTDIRVHICVFLPAIHKAPEPLLSPPQPQKHSMRMRSRAHAYSRHKLLQPLLLAELTCTCTLQSSKALPRPV